MLSVELSTCNWNWAIGQAGIVFVYNLLGPFLQKNYIPIFFLSFLLKLNFCLN